MSSWLSINTMLIFLIAGIGVGIGVAAVLLTYFSWTRIRSASEAQPTESLERLKVWSDFWKYFLVSFALVLITTLLGNTLKERELALQKAKDDNSIAMEKAKQLSVALIAENTNLGSFLDRALVDSWQKRFAFASYFKYLSRDPEAQKRWGEYAEFIANTQKDFSRLEAENLSRELAISELIPQDPLRAALEIELEAKQSEQELKNAILQPSATFSVNGVNLMDGGTLYECGLSVTADGSPHAYHRDNVSGLDYLANAGHPGNWWGLITDNGASNGTPVIQSATDPAPGFYVSRTMLTDRSKDRKDPRCYVDSETVPYTTVPRKTMNSAGMKVGDLAAVLNVNSQKLCYAVVAAPGPNNRIGEGSIALANALGINSNVKHGGVGGGIIYKMFPNSSSGWPKTNVEINIEAERLLTQWGGQARMEKELKFETRKLGAGSY